MDLLVVLLAVIVAAVLGVGLLVAGIARSRRRSNEVVPGTPSPAPPSWAGAHTAEARLHRRLRDAVRSVRAQRRSPGTEELGASLEEAALELDAHLVEVAALPERLRAEPLARIEGAVATLEEAAAALALGGPSSGASSGAPPGVAQVDEAVERLRLLAEARAELDAAVPDLTARPATPAELPPEPVEERRQEPGTSA